MGGEPSTIDNLGLAHGSQTQLAEVFEDGPAGTPELPDVR